MKRNNVILILKGILNKDKFKKVHISLNTGRFYNGTVVSFTDGESLNFIDNKIGQMPIPYDLILNIEPKIARAK